MSRVAKSDLVETAKAVAQKAGYVLRVRQMPGRTDGFHFRFSSVGRYSNSYGGKLVEDVEKAIKYDIEMRAAHAEEREKQKLDAAKFKRQKERRDLAFKYRFGDTRQVVLGPLRLILESIDDETVTVYCQHELTWDEFEEVLRSKPEPMGGA